ncbi:MAG: hypothetical protein K9G64_03590 [Bacteroidia bacterium]|nr:hypothetical protein [Bacteroidia bacterium]
MRLLIISILCIVTLNNTYAQGCCSGGSGSPIAGGVSQGVLQEGQLEFGLNHQYSYSNNLYKGSVLDTAFVNKIDNLNSNYLYFRMAYGVTKNLTLSVESGYFLNRDLIKLHPENIDNTQKSSGIADLIIFPRYDLYNKSKSKHQTEITVGLGVKIPLGKYNDSSLVYEDPITGQKQYTTSAPTVQPTNGSHDLFFYSFAMRDYKKLKFKVFANAMYVKKGWNPLGQKFGDYFSVGLFIGKTFFKKIGVTLQAKGEWIDAMQSAPEIDLLAIYNIDINSTGSEKYSVVPQINYSLGSFTFFVMSDIPFYQNMRGTQIGAKYQFTTGITYRFIPKKFLWKKV